jgi:hypothetical protein
MYLESNGDRLIFGYVFTNLHEKGMNYGGCGIIGIPNYSLAPSFANRL